MKRSIRMAALGVLVAPGLAFAELDYTYVEGAAALYMDYDFQFGGEGEDFIGFDVRGSLDLDEVFSNVFVFGNYKFLTDDSDLTSVNLGGAYRFDLDEQTDAWAGAGLSYQELDIDGVGDDDDVAPAFHGGVRHQLEPDLEVGVSARLVMGDADYTGFTGTVRKNLDDNLKLLVELDSYNGELGLLGGMQWAF